MNNIKSGPGAVLVALLLVMSASAAAGQSQDERFQEGVHYTAIEGASVVPATGVEVVEAFSYLCNHCATFEPYISSWQQRKSASIVFKRIPVIFGRGNWELYARAYVTADMMGIADKAHGALMDKLWKERAVLRSIEELGEFYAGFGVTADAFVATSKSFAIDARVRREQAVVEAAGVHGTPSLIVNGKYLVAGNAAVGSFEIMLEVVDFLVAKELAALPPAPVAAPEPAAAEPAEG